MFKLLRFLIGLVLVLPFVFAAGGGGGGGPPSCKVVDWVCSEWNECNSNGFISSSRKNTQSFKTEMNCV